MGQLQELKSQLDGLGFEIIAIAPDPPEKLAEVRDRVGLDFALLSDVDFEAAKAYGVAFMNNRKRSLPVPSLFVIAPNRKIQFQYINPNYRERIDDDVLVTMAKAVARDFEIGR